MEQNIQQQVEQGFAQDDHAHKKYWALMLFNTELELGISNKPNKWVNTKNIFFNKGIDALEAYSNTPNPASQLIDAISKEELVKNMEEMLEHFNDKKWLEENLYPCL